ncbi:MAG: hypothetical protein VYE22_31070 [Myxococcota bacterium]|nr:hypothetical protein [Myxococcota bacterium]
MFEKDELEGWLAGYEAREMDAWLAQHPGVIMPAELRRMWRTARYGRVGSKTETAVLEMRLGGRTSELEILPLFRLEGRLGLHATSVDAVYETTKPGVGADYRPFMLDGLGNVLLWDASVVDGEVIFLDRTHWRAFSVCGHVGELRSLLKLAPRY